MIDHNSSPLQRTVALGATDFWNDSCSLQELRYAMAHGATGATSNPTIVLQVLRQEMELWQPRVVQLIAENPTWSEEELAWRVVEDMAVGAAELLLPVFTASGGRKGRLSIQTNPQRYRDARALVEQALHFHGLAPNMQVKIPATQAGLAAIEECTAQGVNINATVCFTVSQTLAVADAVERGLRRAASGGVDVESMVPVCTLMVGRLDDWLKVVAEKLALTLTPGQLDWAGVACIKHAHRLFTERGYRTRLLAAAYRSHLHWSELVGGDLILTIPWAWQRLFNASDIEVRDRMQDPLPDGVFAALHGRLKEFRRAYDVAGLRPDEFESYGATVRTLRGFISSYHELVAVVRDCMLPDPDR